MIGIPNSADNSNTRFDVLKKVPFLLDYDSQDLKTPFELYAFYVKIQDHQDAYHSHQLAKEKFSVLQIEKLGEKSNMMDPQ